jgi:hypothetical protein
MDVKEETGNKVNLTGTTVEPFAIGFHNNWQKNRPVAFDSLESSLLRERLLHTVCVHHSFLLKQREEVL